MVQNVSIFILIPVAQQTNEDPVQLHSKYRMSQSTSLLFVSNRQDSTTHFGEVNKENVMKHYARL